MATFGCGIVPLGNIAGSGTTVVWAADLGGSGNANQIVVGLTGAASNLPIASTAPTLEWATATVSPKLYQADDTANSATGDTLTIQAQNATGTTATGGGLTLASGTGTTAAGDIVLKSGSTSRMTIAPAYTALGANTAAAGVVRLSNLTDICWRNAANSADAGGIYADASGYLMIGPTAAAVYPPSGMIISAASASTIAFKHGAVTSMTVGNTGVELGDGVALTWPGNMSGGSVTVGITSRTSDANTNNLIWRGQGAWSSAVTNLNGGNVYLQGGARTNNTGTKGGVILSLNASASDCLVQAVEVQAEATKPSRVLALVQSAGLTTTQMPSDTGDLVVFIGNCAVAPTADPVGGGILYCEAGALKYRGTSGTITTLGVA